MVSSFFFLRFHKSPYTGRGGGPTPPLEERTGLRRRQGGAAFIILDCFFYAFIFSFFGSYSGMATTSAGSFLPSTSTSSRVPGVARAGGT